MYAFLPKPVRAKLRCALATLSLCVSGMALAADASSGSSLAQADAPDASAPIPLNSGVSPHEFGADASKVTLERAPNGTRVYHMNGQGMQSLVAHLGADGRMTYDCTDKTEQIVDAAAGTADER